MPELKLPFDRETRDRFFFMVKALATDPDIGRTALAYFFGLILFLLVINGLNVVNSYVGRDFMTAIAERNQAGFAFQALLYIGVFAASTVASVLLRYIEESLGLLWRKWLTWRVVRRYADHRVFFRIAEAGEVGNPDQRIADDIRSFTATSLSFFLMLLNGFLTVLAFSGVLVSISPLLFAVAVLYASAGTYLTFRLGKPLIRLNYDQSDKEANFRASLIRFRENADLVALARRDGQLAFRAERNLDDLADNYRRIIGINRNVGFFTTGYNWLIQIIPALFVAPMFIDGEVEFGVITQSAVAFTQLLGAFSLIVTQFQSISSFTAVITRVGILTEAGLREDRAEVAAARTATDDWRTENTVVYRGLTLRSPRSGRILVEKLDGEIPAGRRVLVYGPDETARAALFRATAGLWPMAEGDVVRPPLDRILFVTERPYLSPGTLSELFLKPRPDRKPKGLDAVPEFRPEELATAKADIENALQAVGLDSLIRRFGGLGQEQDWDSVLPLGEQQLLVLARVLVSAPRFVFLDRPGTALAPEQLDLVLNLLAERGSGYVVFAENGKLAGRYDEALELKADGGWKWRSVGEGRD
jgi:putative ATP-binding cassette transporter